MSPNGLGLLGSQRDFAFPVSAFIKRSKRSGGRNVMSILSLGE
jgi:hypothetical protein